MNLTKRPVWAEINLECYSRNLAGIRAHLGPSPLIMAVVKADAYGHGAIQLGRTAIQAGADRLGVAIVEEGVELRRAGLKVPIQAMGGCSPAQVISALEHDIIITINDKELARGFNRLARTAGKKLKVHVKVDTGMGRMGSQPEQAVELALEVKKLENLELEGLMSHMSSADEPQKEYSHQQFHCFQEVIGALEGQGLEIPLRHIANSATLIDLPEMALDMVRPGIMTYGLWPSADVNKEALTLEPVLEWKAKLLQVKEVPPGSHISYGRTYTTSGTRRLALLPLGYADGFNRLLSNQGDVLIRGQRAPIRGRVCMDQTVVDVTDIEGVKIGDEAVIIGPQGNEEITVDEIAEKIGTINYEVVCMINKRVPRFICSKEL